MWIRCLSLHRESLSADTSAVDTSQRKLLRKIEEGRYTLGQIFNADETALWWQLMPSKTLARCEAKETEIFLKIKERSFLINLF